VSVFDAGVGFRLFFRLFFQVGSGFGCLTPVSVFGYFFGYFFKSVPVSVVPKTSVISFGFCFCTCALSFLLDFNYLSSILMYDVSPVDGEVQQFFSNIMDCGERKRFYWSCLI
jgi:hypothetical protein